jgi:hypothetical protein
VHTHSYQDTLLSSCDANKYSPLDIQTASGFFLLKASTLKLSRGPVSDTQSEIVVVFSVDRKPVLKHQVV